MSLTKVSYSMIQGAPANVLDFGADPTGVNDSWQAFTAALTASDVVYVPIGTYKIATQIDIIGDKTICGAGGLSSAAQVSVLNFTAASGNLFSAISAEFGAISISNLSFIGGNGNYAIRSSRVQSVFENLLMEDYEGGGIQLFENNTLSEASWGTFIRQVKWVAPAKPTPYIGFDLTINGGHVTLDGCTAIRGSVGINVNKGQAINIYRCSLNLQTNSEMFPFSSLPATSQCGVRFSDAGIKEAMCVKNCYIEACTYGVYVEKCESLTLEDNYIADAGLGSNYSSLYLKSSIDPQINVKNVTVRNNVFNDQGNNLTSVDIGDRCQNVMVVNNWIRTYGVGGICIRKGNEFYSYIQNNTLIPNPYSGEPIVDPNQWLVNLDYQNNGFYTYRQVDLVCVNDTWYNLGPIDELQIWQVEIFDSVAPDIVRRADQLFINRGATVAQFETLYDINPGYAVRQFRVDNKILQFRTHLAGGDTTNTVCAIRLA